MNEFQVVVVGGGPAGLQAALLMARGRTRALVYDSGTARHLATPHAHSFLGADGMPPEELRRRGREQLKPYGTIDYRAAKVTGIEKGSKGGFLVSAEGQPKVKTRFVLLALGMVDIHLDIPGYQDFWGKSVLHCPYCHGWEFRDQPLGVLAPTSDMLDMGLKLTSWSSDITVFIGREVEIPPEFAEREAASNVAVEKRPVRRLLGSKESGQLEAVELEDGTRICCAAVFYSPKQRQYQLVEELRSSLGLKLTEDDFVEVDESKQTSVQGIYAAGDLTTDYQHIAEAVALGHRAALSIELTLKKT